MRKMIGVVVAVASFAMAMGAFAKTKDEKLCADLASFKDSVSRINNLGPQNTVKDLQMLSNQAIDTGRRITKEARHDSHAQQLSSAIDELHRSVQQLPPNATLATAKAQIKDQVSTVKTAARDFEQTRCQQQ